MSHNPLSNHPDLIPGNGYGFTGKLMLSAVVVLTTVVVIMVCFHIYARWYIMSERRRHLRRRHMNRNRLVFYADLNTPNSYAASRGLDADVMGSLPVLLYSHETPLDLPECAVCLSEFEENQKVRLLPKCNHGFHIECIDMWFHSHSTCPLCRSTVEPAAQMKDLAVSVGEVLGVSASISGGFFAACQQEGIGCSSSLGGRRTEFDMERVTIEVPRRTYESDDELRSSSPATEELKSAIGTRLKSLKSMMSLNRKGTPVSPLSGGGTSRGFSASVSDVERGRNESTRG